MTTALGKTIKEAKAGKLDPADVHAIEQDKRRLLGTFTAPFGGRSFKKYYRALECIEDNGKIADIRKCAGQAPDRTASGDHDRPLAQLAQADQDRELLTEFLIPQ